MMRLRWGNAEEKSVKSKLFFDQHKPAGDRKAQFVWCFKAEYWTIELATDYSCLVIGHPKQKYLFIMACKPTMVPELLKEIIERCRQLGYDTGSLVNQEH